MAQSPKTFQETIRELWDLLRAYAQQETVGPLRNLGQRLGFGIAGSLLFGFGWFLVVLGLMRFLQTHDPFGLRWFREHDWSIYLIAIVLFGLAIGLVVRKIRQPDPQLGLSPREDGRSSAPPPAGPTATTGTTR